MERIREWRDVSAREVIGPEVKGDRMRARNGVAKARGEICVIS